MPVSCCGSTRSIYLSDESEALTEPQIVDGILLNLGDPSRKPEVAEIVARMFDAIEEKNFVYRPIGRRKSPTPAHRPGPMLVSQAN